MSAMAVACFTKQLLRCALFKPIGKRARPTVRTLTHSRAREAPVDRLSRRYRDFHTTSSAVAKMMTADELFSMKSLQDYLRTVDSEYSECVRAVHAAELHIDEEELRARRARLTALGPLVQTIRALDSKQRDFEETETLLKGREGTPGCLLMKWQGK